MSIVWFGGEDSELIGVSGATVSTTAGTFRTPQARCSLEVPAQTLAAPMTSFWSAPGIFSQSNFWLGAWCNTSSPGFGVTIPTNGFLVNFTDASGVVRLRLIASTTSQASNLPWTLQKINAAGVATTLATSSIGFTTQALTKLDFAINYAVAGGFIMYISRIPVLVYSGDVTTDSVTALAGFNLGQAGCQSTTPANTFWSECIISTTDTRSLSLNTEPPNGAGATFGWNGTASGSTIIPTTVNTGVGIDTATANQSALFTQPGTLASNFILAFGVSALAMTNSGQPQHIDLLIRQGGTVYSSADIAVGASFANVQAVWNTDPNTGAPWASISGTQIGVESKA